MGKGSNYDKLVLSAYERCEVDLVSTLKEYHESLQCLERYFKGVPWELIKPENRPVLDYIIGSFYESVIDEMKIKLIDYWRMRTPRYRPVFERILEHIISDLERLDLVVTEYWRRPSEIYRVISGDLRISWRTVRDAFWTFRQAGILE